MHRLKEVGSRRQDDSTHKSNSRTHRIKCLKSWLNSMNWGASSNTLPHSRELQNDWPTSGSTSKLLVLERAGGLVAPGVTQLAAAYRAQPSHSAPRNRRLDLYVNLPLFYRLFRCFCFFLNMSSFFFCCSLFISPCASISCHGELAVRLDNLGLEFLNSSLALEKAVI